MFTDEWHVADEVTLAARERGAGLPSGQPSPTTCGVLRAVACATNASAVVQAGADSGVSGLALAGMAPGGILTSIEATPEADRAARQLFRGGRRRGRCPLHHGQHPGRDLAPGRPRLRHGRGGRRRCAPGDLSGTGATAAAPGVGPRFSLACSDRPTRVLDPARRDEATAAERHFLESSPRTPTVTATLLPIDGGVLVVQLPRD